MIIYVPEDVIQRLDYQMRKTPESTIEVLSRAINETATSTRKSIAQKARGTYTVKTTAFNKSMKIEKATKKNIQAVIYSEGKPMALYGFKMRKNMGTTAAKAQVLNPGHLKEISLKDGADNGKELKAFVQKMKTTGHIGIFRRKSVEEKRKKAKTPRNAIKQLYGPSIPQMLGNKERVYEKVRPLIAEELRKNLEKHILVMMEGIG